MRATQIAARILELATTEQWLKTYSKEEQLEIIGRIIFDSAPELCLCTPEYSDINGMCDKCTRENI